MSFFFVDDQFYSHPKHAEFPTECEAGPRTADEVELAAIGLWVKAGAWCKDKLTGGHVPVGQVRKLGARLEHAEFLVLARWWKRTERGYVFHDWEDLQETAAELELKKERHRNNKQAWRKKKAAKAARALAQSAHQPGTPDEDSSDIDEDEPGDDHGPGGDGPSDTSEAGGGHREDAPQDMSEDNAGTSRGQPNGHSNGHAAGHVRGVQADASTKSPACPHPVLGSPSPSPSPPPIPDPPEKPSRGRGRAYTREGGALEFPDADDDLNPGEPREPPMLERPTYDLVRDEYAVAFRAANNDQAPTWTRGNQAHARTIAVWVDEQLRGGDAAVLVKRLVAAFFEHEDAATALSPIALIASNPAKYLAPRAHKKRNGKSADAFMAPASSGSYPATNLDDVFGPDSAIAEG